MDYSAIINSIRTERLELVEIHAENRLDLLETLNHLTTTPSMIQLILPLMEQYRQLKNDISSMLDNLDALEEKLIARVIYWLQESQTKQLYQEVPNELKSWPNGVKVFGELGLKRKSHRTVQ